MVAVGDAIKELMKTHVQHPPRKMQSMTHDGPLETSKYAQFQ